MYLIIGTKLKFAGLPGIKREVQEDLRRDRNLKRFACAYDDDSAEKDPKGRSITEVALPKPFRDGLLAVDYSNPLSDRDV